MDVRRFSLTAVSLLLLNPQQHPIKPSRGYLPAAEFTNAGIVDLERRPTIRTIQVSTCRHCLRLPAANTGPVLTPLAKVGFRAANNLAAIIDRVIVALRTYSQRD